MQLPVLQPNRPAEGQPTIFEKIGIVGRGLIGGSIALAARQIWPTSLVIGVDNKDVLETAMRLHAIDVAADDPYVLAEADLVILAAPVKQNIELLAALDENVTQPAVVTAVGAQGLSLSGKGLADTTRLASSPPEIWRDITATNADEIGPALDQLIAVLQDLRRDLPKGDTLADVFTEAADWRRTLKP